jgi:adenine deaminase
MATLNAAEHFGLDHLIGGIAPGRLADMLIIPDIRHIEALTVISNGQVIARGGSLLKKARRHVYPRHVFQTIRLPRPASQSDFKIEIDSDRANAKVRVIQMVTDLVTREVHLDLPLENGELKADPDRDLLKIAAIDRAHGDGRRFVGLIQGFNMHRGAIACSTGWDSADIVVVGAVESDMAAAVNRIHELGGAAIISDQGNIIGQVDLPVLGIASDHSLQTTLDQVLAFNRAAADLGIQFADPLLTLSTLTGAAIPYLRICEEGLVNLKDGKTVGLVVAD